jgi:hypothetical protein
VRIKELIPLFITKFARDKSYPLQSKITEIKEIMIQEEIIKD